MSRSRRIDMHSMKKVLAMAFFSWYRLTDCHTIGHVMFVWSSVHVVNWCNVHCISCGEYGEIHAEPPSEVCFKEVSIDVSCTLTVDEGSAAFCVGEERPDAQLGAWIAMTASVATVVAFVAIGAVVACQMMKQ